MSVDNLIQDLSADLAPVKPLKGRWHRFALTSGISAVFLSAGVGFWFWLKGEFNMPIGRSLLEASLLFGIFAVALWQAVQSMSPHTARVKASRWEWWLTLLWLAVIGVAFYSLFQHEPEEALIALKYNTWACPKVIFTIALPAAVGLYWYLRKGASLYPRNMDLSWAMAALSLGLFGLAFICPWADPLHELLWHALPAGLGVMGLLLTSRVFRKT